MNNKKIRLRDIAKLTGISNGHLSDMLTGKTGVGKQSAKKMGRLSNRPWIQFMDMDRDTMIVVLKEAAKTKLAAGVGHQTRG